jgi:hypothetical protein
MPAVDDAPLETTPSALKLANGDASAGEAVEGGQTTGNALVGVR